MNVCCGGLGVGIETACRKWQFQAEPRWQTLRADFLRAERRAGTHARAHSHEAAAGQGARLESGLTK